MPIGSRTPQLTDDGEHGERRQHVFDGVAAQGAAEQSIDLQVEGLEHLGEAVPDGRPGQQAPVAVAAAPGQTASSRTMTTMDQAW